MADARDLGKAFFNLAGGIGFHDWQPMSFSPQTGLVYIPVQKVVSLYVNDPACKSRPGAVNVGVDAPPHGLPATRAGLNSLSGASSGWLLTWNPVKHKEPWRVPRAQPWNGGTLTAAGDQPRVRELLSSEHFSVDGTLIEAWAEQPKVPTIRKDRWKGCGGVDEELSPQGRARPAG